MRSRTMGTRDAFMRAAAQSNTFAAPLHAEQQPTLMHHWARCWASRAWTARLSDECSSRCLQHLMMHLKTFTVLLDSFGDVSLRSSCFTTQHERVTDKEKWCNTKKEWHRCEVIRWHNTELWLRVHITLSFSGDYWLILCPFMWIILVAALNFS